MSAPASTTTRSSLHRSLSFRDLVVYGLLFIGPLAPVGVFGVLDARTNGAIALTYVFATVAMAFTAWSYAEMSRVVPHAGSVFAYATEGLGRHAGFLAGWLAMLDYLLIPSVAYLFSGIALHALVPSVPAWVFTVAAFATTTALNLAGVSRAARVGTVVLIVEIAVLIVFLVVASVVLASGGATREWYTPVTSVDLARGPLLSAIIGAVSVAVLSYLGFDAIAAFAEETTGSPQIVGRAILVCLLGSGLLFVAQTWLGAMLSPIAPEALVRDPARQGTAFYDMLRSAIGPWMSATVALAKAVGPAFAAMTAQAAAARLLFGMARDGRLPSALAKVDAARGVPRVSLMTTACLTLAVSVWAARRADGLDVLVSIVDMGALAAFTLLHLSVIGYFVVQRRGPCRAAHWMLPALGALVAIWVIAEASSLAKLVAGSWALVGGVLAFIGGPRPRASSASTVAR